MRDREAIEERLRTLTQAYHLAYLHREELGCKAGERLRLLQESIGLLQWCLEDEPEPPDTTWHNVRAAFGAALRLLGHKLPGW